MIDKDAEKEFVFKIATEAWEFDQIHKLNYRTFAQEIPQHPLNPERKLVDKFHNQNKYLICLSDHEVIGMLAVRSERPFSLDAKLDNLDSYLPKCRFICEVRLLAVKGNHRNGQVLKGLLQKVVEYSMCHGYDLAVISGTVRQERLYRHMGFVPFGPLVGAQDALYQPMYLTMEQFREKIPFAHRHPENSVNLLPGPVKVHSEVRKAFGSAPVSHRSDEFVRDINDIKRMLCELVNARQVELLQGSGTLANDVIGTELSLLSVPGLVLSNGEFGERLVDHAARCRLKFNVLRVAWGEAFRRKAVEEFLSQHRDIGWVWCVHCETSTGVLNELDWLKTICDESSIFLCLDAVSSIGSVNVDLQGVYLASGVSSKGLASFPGLTMVFSDHEFSKSIKPIPRYLDLSYYAEKKGIPFTISSNLVYALRAALKRLQPQKHFQYIRELSSWLRKYLRTYGFRIIAPDTHSAPAVITISLPKEIHSGDVGRRLEKMGYFLSYNSEYLRERNWMQICLMGECSRDNLVHMVDVLSATVACNYS